MALQAPQRPTARRLKRRPQGTQPRTRCAGIEILQEGSDARLGLMSQQAPAYLGGELTRVLCYHMQGEPQRAMNQSQRLAPRQRHLRGLLEHRLIVGGEIQDQFGSDLGKQELAIEERRLSTSPLPRSSLLEDQLGSPPRIGRLPSFIQPRRLPQEVASQVTVSNLFLGSLKVPSGGALRQLTMVESDHHAAGRGTFREVWFQIQREPRPDHHRQAALADVVVLAVVEVVPNGVVRGEHIQDFAFRQAVARRRQIAQAALHQNRPVIRIAGQPVKECVDDARDAFAQPADIRGRVRLPEPALLGRQLQIERQATAFEVRQHGLALPRLESAPRIPEPLVQGLAPFRPAHRLELDEHPCHILCGRNDHLDVRRQLLREPSHEPCRIGAEKLIGSVDEENQRLIRCCRLQPLPEGVFELCVIDRSFTRCDLLAEAGEERVAARRFGRRSDKTSDHPARTLVPLRRFSHQRGLA